MDAKIPKSIQKSLPKRLRIRFFEKISKKVKKNLQVQKKCLPLQSQTKRMGVLKTKLVS